mmetsp:Transcript_37722/g.65474  ORF Transcript_37722/g.65474 Transcript_37722/m.65474 type:complete len:213 (+) Transcript_37722:121-759(+)|eukprot:CAMPEP_0194563848 /NCGR_PEP_ID=MMETSP0292-20121207/3741_1 /TAXON_ID=39354 /ORGANISM="Heterosigma akashiwo, Strain CCMP2393" /LENGTH=212 /DNA_ID=CAMNT_0039412863 /DNA_START=120 /DNA_END=758 /DNA_ORIENTATION=+
MMYEVARYSDVGPSADYQSPEQRALSRKHALQKTWTIWFDNPKLKKPNETWEENLKELYSLDTVEDFWSLYNNIQPASKLAVGSTYHFFAQGIRPMWEDKQNVDGGKWTITLSRGSRDRTDEIWLYTMLAVIGETLDDDAGEVLGCVCSVRARHTRVALWTRTAADAARQLAVGRRLRAALDLPAEAPLAFQAHRDAARAPAGSRAEVLYEA